MNRSSNPDPLRAEALLTNSEVAALFNVDPRTVANWARAGRISCFRTLGGHRRYRASEIAALIQGTTTERKASPA